MCYFTNMLTCVLLLCSLLILSAGQQKSVWCIKCSSYRGDNPGCVKGQIPYIPSNFRNCSAPCFYTLSEPADSSTMTRGCTSDQPDLPIILPPKGCYSWRGALVCVCFTPYCNMEEIEPTYQLSLDYLQPSSSSQSTSTTLSSTAAPILSTSSETAPVVTTSRVTTDVVPTSPETSPAVPTSTETTSTTASSSVKTSTASSPVVTLLQSSSASVGSSLPDTSLTTSAAQTSENVTSPTTSITEITTLTTAEKIQTPPTAPASIDITSGTTPTSTTITTSAVTTTPVTTQTSSTVTSTTVTTPPTTQTSPTTATSAVTTPVTTQTSSTVTSTTVITPPTTTSPPIPTASTNSTVITSRLTTVLTTTRPTRATPPTVGANFSIDCFSCSNYDVNGQLFKACPKDANVDLALAYLGNCSGPCFTRNDPRDDKLVVRGCTSTIGILPNPLPATGCYDWEGATYCICYDSSCNMAPIGLSSNVSLDDHLINGDTEIVQEGPLQCYQCVANDSLSSLCPKNGVINTNIVYREPCPGVCFTRSFKDDPNKVARGCTSSQYAMPSPLPRSGCYSWNQETWCICNTTNCNRYAIGNSSGVEFDAHLDDIPFVVEPDGIKKCYQCVSFANGQVYPQCPKKSRVRNAYLSPCNGTCYISTSAKDANIVSRGCADDQPSLPKPLPRDGCYNWYTEVWCICSNSRCNGAALGTSSGVELDAHLTTNKDGKNHSTRTSLQLPLILVALSFFFSRILRLLFGYIF